MAATDPGRTGRSSRSSGRPTVRDVAEVAGVSFKTVARVVNGEPGVRPETAERVMAAVRELGFKRNAVAASFSRGVSTETVGLIIDDISNPFFATLARAIEEVTRVQGLQVVLASSDRDPQRERAVIESLVAQRLGGLLIVPVGRDHRYLAREVRHGTAVVFLDRPQGYLRADTVTVDNYGGARLGTRHLIEHGHRRIGVLAESTRVHTVAERLRGIRDELADHRLHADDDHVKLELGDVDEAAAAASELLANPRGAPTAFFAVNNRMTVGAIGAIADAKHGVAVIGFDDFELAAVMDPPITVLRHDVRHLGRLGAELLLRRMNGWDADPEKIVLPVELVARGSGEISPGHSGS